MPYDAHEELRKAIPGHGGGRSQHHINHQEFAVAQTGFWQESSQKLIERKYNEQDEYGAKEYRYDGHVNQEPHRLRYHDPIAVHKYQDASND